MVNDRDLVVLLREVIRHVRARFYMGFVANVMVIQRRVKKGKNFIHLPRRFNNFLMRTYQDRRINGLRPYFRYSVPLTVTFYPVRVSAGVVSNEITSVYLMLLVGFSVPSGGERVNNINVRRLTLRPNGTPFARNSVIPVHLSDLVREDHRYDREQHTNDRDRALPCRSNGGAGGRRSPFRSRGIRTGVTEGPTGR